MKILELNEYTEKFEIDTMNWLSEIETSVKAQNPNVIYVMDGAVSPYSGVGPLTPEFSWFTDVEINRGALYHVVNETRVKKSPEEIDLMRNAAKIGCDAHKFVMKNIKPGQNEVHVQTMFRVISFKF